MTFWEAIFCLCRRENVVIHPVNTTEPVAPVPPTHNNSAPEPEPLISPETVVDSASAQTAAADVTANTMNHDVEAKAETDVEDKQKNEEEEKHEEVPKVAPDSLEQLKNEEINEAQIFWPLPSNPVVVETEEGLQKDENVIPGNVEVDAIRITVNSSTQDKRELKVVETLTRAAEIVKALSQEQEENKSKEDTKDADVNTPEEKAAKNEESVEPIFKPITAEVASEEKSSVQLIEPAEDKQKIKKPPRVELNGANGKWHPNDTSLSQTPKLSKVNAASVRENKKQPPISISEMKKNAAQIHFQGPRRSSVPVKKDVKKKKRVGSDELHESPVVEVKANHTAADGANPEKQLSGTKADAPKNEAVHKE